jgi:predicted metal-dependent enzyme (double-stranded beta helix superfamily)
MDGEANVIALHADARCDRAGLFHEALITDIERACDGPPMRFVHRLLGALRHHSTDEHLVRRVRDRAVSRSLRPRGEYIDPAGRFRIDVMTWQAGQVSTVHAHDTWRALAIVDGWLREDLYDHGDATADAGHATSLAVLPGSVQFRLPGDATVHRLRNVGSTPTVSLHVRGLRPAAVRAPCLHREYAEL